MKRVYVLLGSESDLPYLDNSKLKIVLDYCNVQYEVDAISAHRQLPSLIEFCKRVAVDFPVFIAGAGMAAALPGTIAAIVSCPVLAVALPSTHFVDAMDALLATTRMPPGVPVANCGIGEAGFENAAIFSCQIIGSGDTQVRALVSKYREAYAKKPKYDIKLK